MRAKLFHHQALLWLLLLCSLATASAESVATLPSSSAVLQLKGLDLSESTPPEALSRRMLIRKEAPDQPMATGDLERILAMPQEAWQSGVDPAARASHFTPTTLWMLGAVANSSEQPTVRWLVLKSWRLWDVRLFAVDAETGVLVAQYEAGQRVPIEKRVIAMPEASFPISLAPGQRLLLLLRIQDKTFGPVVATLHDPGTRKRQATRMHEALVALLGFIIAIVLVLLVQGDWRYAIVALWLAATAVYEFVYLVPLQPRLFPTLTPFVVPILTISGSLAVAAFALMTLTFLQLFRNHFWLIVYGGLTSILLAASLIIPWAEQHHLVRRVAGTTAMAVVFIWPLAAWTARQILTQPYGRMLITLFAVYWIVELGRIIVINGVVNLDLYNDPIMLLYLLGLLLFALGIVAIDSHRRRDLSADLERQFAEREAAERQRTLEQQRLENVRLAAAVEEQTRALREASRRAQSDSAAKSNFLSTASHELRAPLHDILGYAQLLRRQAAEETHGHLSVIQKSGHQLLRLIDEILDFSRSDAKPIVLDPAPISLRALAAQLQAAYQPRAARGGNQLNTHIELGAIDAVIADEDRLSQILRNLLENACKFTKNGKIELRIERRSAPESTPVTEGEAPILLRFSVSDTGIGIPVKDQTTIFEPFKRLEHQDRTPGLGLGLAISQQLAGAMGGRIEVSSPQAGAAGTRFSLELSLPRTDSCPASLNGEQQPEIIGYLGQRRTLLIVDDLASSREFLAESCEHLGFDILQAENGAQALDLLRCADPKPDAALVDQFMPQVDGWAFLHQVRESATYCGLPVAMISAAPLQPPADFPSEIGFDEVALKPLSATTLAEILKHLLGLEWQYEDRGPDQRERKQLDRALSMARALPADCCAEQLAELRRMLSLGAVSAILQWAKQMRETHPDFLHLWQQIEQYATRVDLDGLHALAASILSSSRADAG